MLPSPPALPVTLKSNTGRTIALENRCTPIMRGIVHGFRRPFLTDEAMDLVVNYFKNGYMVGYRHGDYKLYGLARDHGFQDVDSFLFYLLGDDFPEEEEEIPQDCFTNETNFCECYQGYVCEFCKEDLEENYDDDYDDNDDNDCGVILDSFVYPESSLDRF